MSKPREKSNGPQAAILGAMPVGDQSSLMRKMAMLVLMVGIALVVIMLIRPAKLDVYKTVTELQFTDPVLAECVKSAASRHKWGNAGQIVSLRCNHPTGDGIERLDGIEHLVVLTEANLAFNRIEDVSPLARLHHLTVVDLSHNKISHLPVFESAPNLKRMELNYNLLDSLDWLTLQHFPVLDSLSMAHNHLADISSIESLTSLSELNVRNNRISTLTPISSLTQLVLLDAGSNLVDDVSEISGLSSLRRLFLDRNRIRDLDGIESLTALEELGLNNNSLESIARIAQLQRLQRLNLSQTDIKELSAVLKLGDLGLLRVSGNPDLGCDSIAEAIREYGRDAVTFDQDCITLRNQQN